MHKLHTKSTQSDELNSETWDHSLKNKNENKKHKNVKSSIKSAQQSEKMHKHMFVQNYKSYIYYFVFNNYYTKNIFL